MLFKNVRISIIELSRKLEIYNFKKISQSTIINMSHMKERDNNHISLFNSNQPFEITNKEKNTFIERLRAKFNI